jgi:hypothetical protein
MCFFRLFHFKPEKDGKQTKKKPLLSQNQTFSSKYVFLVFGFPGIPKTSGFVLLFFQGFCGFGDSDSRYLYII